jgi:hypothetical protein
MNKIYQSIGRITLLIEYIIRLWSTMQVAVIIITMPLQLMIMIHYGRITQVNALQPISWYAFYSVVAAMSWSIWYIQKYLIEKSKYYQDIQSRKEWRNNK